MEVITLVGKQNSGKTTTLKNLILEFEKSGAKLLSAQSGCGVIDPSILKGFSLLQYFHQNNPSDPTVKFQYKNRSIGITTLGDKYKDIVTRFKLVEPCDVFVCASHDFAKLQQVIRVVAATNVSFRRVDAVRCQNTSKQVDFKVKLCCDYANYLALKELMAQLGL